MIENSDVNTGWKEVEDMLIARFGKIPNMETILFLIGIQELRKGKKKFSKEEKEYLMHIAMCTILSPDGYYRFDKYDNDGWPHFTELKKVHGMKIEEQEEFLREHIIQYFKSNNNIHQIVSNSAHH